MISFRYWLSRFRIVFEIPAFVFSLVVSWLNVDHIRIVSGNLLSKKMILILLLLYRKLICSRVVGMIWSWLLNWKVSSNGELTAWFWNWLDYYKFSQWLYRKGWILMWRYLHFYVTGAISMHHILLPLGNYKAISGRKPLGTSETKLRISGDF